MLISEVLSDIHSFMVPKIVSVCRNRRASDVAFWRAWLWVVNKEWNLGKLGGVQGIHAHVSAFHV